MAKTGLTKPVTQSPASLVGETAGMLAPFGFAAKSAALGGDILNAVDFTPANAVQKFTANGKISDPKQVPLRSFLDDYPQGTGLPAGSRLTTDLDGNPLTAKYIAGRQIVGGNDVNLDLRQLNDAAGSLGASTKNAGRATLGSDLGQYIRGSDTAGNTTRQIVTSADLTLAQRPTVFAHETGHLIDDLTYGGAIPQDGIKNELKHLYNQLNNPRNYGSEVVTTPKTFGYKTPDSISSEYMAEAIRAYLRDPNYIKTVAPNTAARIRQYVNTNQNLNKVVQFNSAAGAGALGLSGSKDDKK